MEKELTETAICIGYLQMCGGNQYGYSFISVPTVSGLAYNKTIPIEGRHQLYVRALVFERRAECLSKWAIEFR